MPDIIIYEITDDNSSVGTEVLHTFEVDEIEYQILVVRIMRPVLDMIMGQNHRVEPPPPAT